MPKLYKMRILLIPALSMATANPAEAHHSFAMFDGSKTVALNGTIKQLKWTNPHCWVQLLVRDARTGKVIEWSIEGMSPNGLTRLGWSRNMAKPGDQAVVEIHPLKDGSPGGALVSVTVSGTKYVTRAGG